MKELLKSELREVGGGYDCWCTTKEDIIKENKFEKGYGIKIKETDSMYLCYVWCCTEEKGHGYRESEIGKFNSSEVKIESGSSKNCILS